MKTLSIVFFVVIFLGIGIPMQANGLFYDGCITLLESKLGTVNKKTPHYLKFKSTAEEITVMVNKTGGKAQAIVYINVDGVRKQVLKFNPGKSPKTKSKSLKGVRHKNIKIEIVNQSAGDKFEYEMTVNGITNSLAEAELKLLPLGKKTLYTSKACNEKVVIKLTRKTGKAKTTIYIYRGNTKVWEGVWGSQQTTVTKSFSSSVNKKYKVEVKNISSQEQINFSMTATQL